MPFVTIRILKGHSQERKDEISRRVTAAVSEIAQLPKDAVWVVFDDLDVEHEGDGRIDNFHCQS
jgi:4-oxalocrotonate tautomerase